MAKDVIIIDRENIFFIRCEKKQSFYNIIALHSLRCEGAPIYKRDGGEVILSEDCLSLAVKLFQEKLNIRLNEVEVILPHAITWFNYLTIEDMPKNQKEAEEFIIWKVQKVMPIPKEHVVVKHHLLSKSKGKTKVLVAATFDNFVKAVEKAFKRLGLLVTYLSPPTVSFLNVFEQYLPKNGVVCWLRETSYSMVCFYEGLPVVIREVDRAINASRIEGELFSFIQTVKEIIPEYSEETVFYFDELQRAELVNNFPQNAKKLEYKKLLQDSDSSILDLPKYICALGIV